MKIQFFIFLSFLIFLYAGDPHQHGRCKSNGEGVLEAEDIETLRFSRRIRYSLPRKRREVQTTKSFFTKKFQNTFKKLENKFNMKRKREQEWAKYREMGGAKSNVTTIQNTTGCLKGMYYCFLDCKTNFKLCDHSQKFILFIPNQLHQDLCVVPRLKQKGTKMSQHFIAKCLTRPCNCQKFESFFKSDFPLVYEEKMQRFQKGCNQLCTTNQRPLSLVKMSSAKKLLSPTIQVMKNFAQSIKTKRRR